MPEQRRPLLQSSKWGPRAPEATYDTGIGQIDPNLVRYLRGAADIPGTAFDYVSESTPRSGPWGVPSTMDIIAGIGSMGLDARALVGAMGEHAKEHPVATARDMSPVIGQYMGLMDAENLMAQAVAAEEAGDDEKASNLRQLATFSLLTALPGIPGIPGIRAWQGSPHKFSKMSSKHIGTGEGVQAYGHGLYFAENPKVAGGTYKNPEGSYSRLSGHMEPKTEMAYDLLEKGMGTTEVMGEMIKKYGPDVSFDDVSRAIDEARDKYNAGMGYLYNVDLKVSSDELLDWDAPLSEQSQKIQDMAAEAFAQETGITRAHENYQSMVDLVRGQLDSKTGQDVYTAIVGIERATVGVEIGVMNQRLRDLVTEMDSLSGPGYRNFTNPRGHQLAAEYDELLTKKVNFGTASTPPEAASARLKELGIPGIKYWDAGSRGVGEGTRNYVVFDDSVVDIRTRNGEALTPVAREIAVGEMTSQTAAPTGVERSLEEGLASLKRNIDINMERRRRGEYVPRQDAPGPEGRRGDPHEPELDRIQREKTLERQKRLDRIERQRRLEQKASGGIVTL